MLGYHSTKNGEEDYCERKNFSVVSIRCFLLCLATPFVEYEDTKFDEE